MCPRPVASVVQTIASAPNCGSSALCGRWRSRLVTVRGERHDLGVCRRVVPFDRMNGQDGSHRRRACVLDPAGRRLVLVPMICDANATS